MNQASVDEIEMIAIKGAAIASLLGTGTALDEAEPRDVQAAFYALEGYFRDILEVLDTSAGPLSLVGK